MLTAEQIRQFRSAEADLDAATVAALLEFLRRLGPVERAQLIEASMDVVPALVDQFGGTSAVLAVTAYDLSRDQSDARGRFTAAPAVGALRRQVQGMVGWATSPPKIAVRDLDTGEITERLAAGTQRLVRLSNRNTIVDSVDDDPDPRTIWARVPRPGACGFCVLLSSRGAAYWSEQSASISSGRNRREATAKRKARGQRAGSAFHDNCRCQIVAMPGGGTKPAELTAILTRFGTVTADFPSPKDAMRAWNRHIDAENRLAAA